MRKVVVAFAALLFAVPGIAYAQGFRVVYTFQNGADGALPVGDLVEDKAGDLYGATEAGGGFTGCQFSGGGCGTIFEVTPQGVETILHAFTNGDDGSVPEGFLRRDTKGDIFGVASQAGSASPDCLDLATGCGTIFKLTSRGAFKVQYTFAANSKTDGFTPDGGLSRQLGGARFGTTFNGGSCTANGTGCGTIFSIRGTTQTILYEFQDNADGSSPVAAPVVDAAGNLYGTTQVGGTGGFGAVYKLASDGTLTVLHSFTNSGDDGASPVGQLLLDSSGNLYGTAPNGGSTGNGVVFKIASDGTYTTLHSFTGSDGSQPRGGLVMDRRGHLYGTTAQGGASCFGGVSHCGVVYELNRNGVIAVLHTFTGGSDGAFPQGSLVWGPEGQLYGTALQGGNTGCQGMGCGTVFSVEQFP